MGMGTGIDRVFLPALPCRREALCGCTGRVFGLVGFCLGGFSLGVRAKTLGPPSLSFFHHSPGLAHLWPHVVSGTDPSCPLPNSPPQFWPKDEQFALCNFAFAISDFLAFKTPLFDRSLSLGQNDRLLAFFWNKKCYCTDPSCQFPISKASFVSCRVVSCPVISCRLTSSHASADLLRSGVPIGRVAEILVGQNRGDVRVEGLVGVMSALDAAHR